MAFSPDGRILASASDRRARSRSGTSRRPAPSTLRRTPPILAVAFSPDGRSPWPPPVTDRDREVWDAATGELLRTLFGTRLGSSGVAYSPDGRPLASAGGEDRTVKLWDANTGTGNPEPPRPSLFAWCVAFSRDGQRLASADRTAP